MHQALPITSLRLGIECDDSSFVDGYDPLKAEAKLNTGTNFLEILLSSAKV